MKKAVLIFILIVFIILFFVFLNINKIKNYYSQTIKGTNNNSTVENDMSLQFSEMTNSQLYNKAIKEDDEQYCEYIEDQNNKDLCYKQLAINNLKLNTCDLINEIDSKKKCVDIILLDKAILEKNISYCEQISEEREQINCVNNLIKDDLDLGYCDALQGKNLPKTYEYMFEFDLKEYCISLVMYNNAKNGDDIKKCDLIPRSEIKAKCYSSVNNILPGSDDDNDGLLYRDEIIFGTDPEKSDTDSDGFLDGEEVKNGYNPRGEGELSNLYYN